MVIVLSKWHLRLSNVDALASPNEDRPVHGSCMLWIVQGKSNVMLAIDSPVSFLTKRGPSFRTWILWSGWEVYLTGTCQTRCWSHLFTQKAARQYVIVWVLEFVQEKTDESLSVEGNKHLSRDCILSLSQTKEICCFGNEVGKFTHDQRLKIRLRWNSDSCHARSWPVQFLFPIETNPSDTNPLAATHNVHLTGSQNQQINKRRKKAKKPLEADKCLVKCK